MPGRAGLRWRTRAIRLAIALGASALAFVAVVAYVAFVGISFDASHLRDRVAALLAQSVGRKVWFTGPMHFELSAHPKLVVRGMHIANPEGYGATDFADLGEARLALDLWPLLRLRLRVEELQGSDVHVRLQWRGDGGNNWTFAPSDRRPDAPAARAAKSVDAQEVGRILARLDISRVSLERLDVEFIDAAATSHYFELQSLLAHFPAGQPLTLALRGTIEKSYPYTLDLTGGALADLAHIDQPWPVDLTLEFMSSRLVLRGKASGRTGAIGFDLGTADLGDFERLLQTRLPAVGDVAVMGRIQYAPGSVTLQTLAGHIGKTRLEGALDVDYGNARPSVRGRLSLPVLDLRPFITGEPAARSGPPKNFAEVYRELSNATFSLSALDRYDADLTLSVGQWLSLPGEVHDARLQIRLDHGRLDMPVQATMAGVGMTGSASANAGVSPPRFAVALGTRDSSVGDLAGLLTGVPGIRGTVGRLDLRISARGDRGAELMEGLDVRLNVERGDLTYGSVAGGRPVKFSLDRLAIAIPAREALRGDARGALLDTKFSATLRGASLTRIVGGADVPIDLRLQAGSAMTQVKAALQPFAQDPRADVTFELSAPHSSEIASWFALKPGADVPIALRGELHAGVDRWHLAGFSLRLGRSRLNADLVHAIDSGRPLTTVQLAADSIDEDELQSVLPVRDAGDVGNAGNAARAAPAARTDAASSMIDIPILPQGINLADADIAVRIDRIANASSVPVRDLRFDGHIRDGMMSASPFAVSVADTPFSGTILLDLRTRQPRSTLSLAAEGLDIGRVLNALGLARELDAGVDRIRVQLDLHSSRLGQLLEQSELAARFEGGHLTLRDANTGAKMRIALDHGELESSAGAPVHLDLAGSLDGAPVSIAMRTATAVDLIKPALPIPVEFDARAFGMSIRLSGQIERPFSDRDVELALNIEGARLDTLDGLFRTALPPWGPWSLAGKFHMTRRGYEVSTLRLQVGASRLTGRGKLDTTLTPPRIDVALAAPTIQLDDFRFGDWSPEKAQPDSGTKSRSIDDLRAQATRQSDQVQQLLSAQVLRRQNAYLTVSVDQVLSARDAMGSGTLEARLEDGDARIGPVVVNAPGGSATFRLGFKPDDGAVSVSLQAAASHFDYGILARRLDPQTEMRGILSLDVDVMARAPRIAEMWRYGKGHIDFAVWPENLKSGLLDMWAVNVLMALLPAVDSSGASKVNCAIGRFTLNDGKLSEKTMLIDTSRMRVTGKGRVDLAAEDILLYAQPRAKTPQFLSFALPVELAGKLDDFHVGVRAGDVLETVAQLAASVVTVPVQSLLGRGLPPDGRDVCALDLK